MIARPCPRCRMPIIPVCSEPPGPIVDYHLSVHPVMDESETAPYFELVDNAWRQRSRPTPRRGGVVHAVHHCPAPARCRQCEQVHTVSDPQPRAGSTSTNNSESETAA